MKKPASVSCVLLGMALILLCGLSSAPQRNWDDWGRHEKQYEELTAAFLAGQLSLIEQPAPFLGEMENPYDPAARSLAADAAGAYALIDTAYYNGKYYTYFGVTPVLLLYLPVRLLTGRVPPTWIAVLFIAALCIPACFLLLRALCGKYFPETACGARCLLSLSLAGVLGLPYLAAFCTTYSMPAVMGLFLTLCGLICFLRAERPDGTMRRPLLVLGSALLALTIGCRPVFAAAFLLLLPLFGSAIRGGAFFRKEKTALINTAAVLLPAVLIGAGFLTYNALRFDNPMEFGFRYLLTTRDMLHVRHSAGETLAGARLLLLEMPRLHRVFPFMEIADYSGRFSDTLYVEPFFGGLLPLHPLLPAGLLLGILTPAFKTRRSAMDPAPSAADALPLSSKRNSAPGAAPLALCSLLLGILILFVDSSLAGISQRYESDFALFLFLPAAIAFLRVFSRAARSASPPGAETVLLLAALLLLTFAEAFLSFSAILCDGRYFAMRDWNPDTYNRIAAFFR